MCAQKYLSTQETIHGVNNEPFKCMMESSYANDNDSFKKFLLDFCSNVIVENEESDDLPFRLVSKQLTSDELEAESLEWSIRYLSK